MKEKIKISSTTDAKIINSSNMLALKKELKNYLKRGWKKNGGIQLTVKYIPHESKTYYQHIYRGSEQ